MSVKVNAAAYNVEPLWYASVMGTHVLLRSFTLSLDVTMPDGKDSSGCVLVGMGRKGDKLTESTPAETMVTMLCRNTTKLAIVEAVG